MPFHGSNRGSNPLGDATSIVRRALAEASRLLSRPRRQATLESAIGSGLPSSTHVAASFMIDRSLERAGLVDVVSRVESRRAEIAAQTDRTFTIWYSPEPQSGLTQVGSSPAIGQAMRLPARRIAATGKDRLWGPALHLLVRSSGAKRVLELGSCAGLSALYMGQCPTVNSLITVEGSADLASLAAESLQFIPGTRVVNARFADAIQLLTEERTERFDLAFIDGHHERSATLFYFEKVFPLLSSGAHVIFDDIRWSADMFDAWRTLRSDARFAHTIDFGSLGVCICKGFADASDDVNAQPQHWDLSKVVGRTRIGRPWGWR